MSGIPFKPLDEEFVRFALNMTSFVQVDTPEGPAWLKAFPTKWQGEDAFRFEYKVGNRSVHGTWDLEFAITAFVAWVDLAGGAR